MLFWKRLEGEGVLREPWPDQVFNEPALQPAATYCAGQTVGLRLDRRSGPAARLRPGEFAAGPRPVAGNSALDPVVVVLDPPSDAGRRTSRPAETTGITAAGSTCRPRTWRQFLAEQQKAAKLGPRVVLLLTGKGDAVTSPIHVKGSTLVLHFEEPAKDEPRLALEAGRQQPGRPHDLDVEDGNLEIMGGVLHTADTPTAALSHVIRVKGGDIKLFRTHVEGPQQSIPMGYRASDGGADRLGRPQSGEIPNAWEL